MSSGYEPVQTDIIVKLREVEKWMNELSQYKLYNQDRINEVGA